MLSWEKFENKRICVAISGGEDSVALLHYLKSQEKRYGYFLSAVHCEHGIRGEESLEDMRFVREICRDWGIPLAIFSADCPALAKEEKTSLETAARKFRYDSFSRLVKEDKTDYIATAHHQKDEAETVLFRMARGAALSGAVAMKEENGIYLRPFLSWSKEKIQGYIKGKSLVYRLDSTNMLTDATRNKIRLEVLPKLEEAVAGATENIARFALLAAEDDGLLRELSESLLQRENEGIVVLFSERKPLFTRACLAALKELGLEKDYTSAHLNALYALQSAERGSLAPLPKGICAEKRKKGIYFSLKGEENGFPLSAEKPYAHEGYDGGRYEVNISFQPTEGDSAWKVLRFDEKKLPSTAVFRFRREGDYIFPYGSGKKSLKKFLNEREIPPNERSALPLIAEREGSEVYAVCGVEISEKIKVEDGETLYLTVRKKER